MLPIKAPFMWFSVAPLPLWEGNMRQPSMKTVSTRCRALPGHTSARHRCCHSWCSKMWDALHLQKPKDFPAISGFFPRMGDQLESEDDIELVTFPPFWWQFSWAKQMIIHWHSDSNGAKKWDTYPKWAQFWKLMINHWILDFALLVDIYNQNGSSKMYVKRDTSQVSGQNFYNIHMDLFGELNRSRNLWNGIEIYNSDLRKWRIFIHWPSNCRISLSYGLSSAMCPLIWRPSLVWSATFISDSTACSKGSWKYRHWLHYSTTWWRILLGLKSDMILWQGAAWQESSTQ